MNDLPRALIIEDIKESFWENHRKFEEMNPRREHLYIAAMVANMFLLLELLINESP